MVLIMLFLCILSNSNTQNAFGSKAQDAMLRTSFKKSRDTFANVQKVTQKLVTLATPPGLVIGPLNGPCTCN